MTIEITQTRLDRRVDRGWRSRAGCRSVDPELFFPTAEAGPVLEQQVAAAKRVCAGCPVRSECLAEATVRIPYGIAGGLTAQERRGLGRAATDSTDVGVLDIDAATHRGHGRAGVGLRLLAAGVSVAVVAARCGVSDRTVERWAATARTAPAGAARAAGGVA